MSTTIDIRLYMPVLQRIIILVAVIIAVPVVLWTITAFVRTYVGPPQSADIPALASTARPTSRASTARATADRPRPGPSGAAARSFRRLDARPQHSAEAAARLPCARRQCDAPAASRVASRQRAGHPRAPPRRRHRPSCTPATTSSSRPIVGRRCRPFTNHGRRITTPAASDNGFAWPTCRADPGNAGGQCRRGGGPTTDARSGPAASGPPSTGRIPLPPRRPRPRHGAELAACRSATVRAPQAAGSSTDPRAAPASDTRPSGWLPNLQPQNQPQDSHHAKSRRLMAIAGHHSSAAPPAIRTG